MLEAGSVDIESTYLGILHLSIPLFGKSSDRIHVKVVRLQLLCSFYREHHFTGHQNEVIAMLSENS